MKVNKLCGVNREKLDKEKQVILSQESRNLVLVYHQIGLLLRFSATSQDVKALPHRFYPIRFIKVKEEHINDECEKGQKILESILLIERAQDMYVRMREHSIRGWGSPQAPKISLTSEINEPQGVKEGEFGWGGGGRDFCTNIQYSAKLLQYSNDMQDCARPI